MYKLPLYYLVVIAWLIRHVQNIWILAYICDEVFALLLLEVCVNLSALIWLLLNWCTLSTLPLNLNSVGLKPADIHVRMSWFGLLELKPLLFAWLLCVDWGHNCRNQRCLHSFCVKTAESPRKLVSPQNNGYQTLLYLPALSPSSLSLQLFFTCSDSDWIH